LPTSEPKTVAIIGAGPLGRWLALAAARAGFRVLLEDVMPTNLHHARDALRQQLGPAGRIASGQGFSPDINGPILTGTGRDGFQPIHSSPEACLSARPDLTFVSTIEEAVRDADLVIDCVPDELESKLEIFWLLDRMAPPRTVLATPTTRLSIADLAHCTYRPAQCVAIAVQASDLTGNPAPGAPGQFSASSPATGPTIRLLKTSRTTPDTITLVEGFWRQLGFTPAFALDPAEKPAS
jgi:3-hydroxybutyryl-CoA dehydrogenase